MPKASPIQTSFNAGEISPRLLGRTELDKYKSGVETLLNMIPLPHGPITSRGGTQYISSSKSGKIRLVAFEYSTIQAYVLEFGDYYIRVYLNKSVLEAGPFSAEFATEFDLPDTLEIVSPYSVDEIFDLQFTQSADVLYIAHGDHAPRTLTRTTIVTWSLDLFETIYGPYMDINQDPTLTITPSATTGSAITLTASDDLFLAGHVGALWRIGSTLDGFVQITGYTSPTVVTADVISDLDGTGATDDWSEGAWSDVNGYPKAVAFYEQRLVWAGTTESPQTLWASQSADYPNYLKGANDTDALIYTIASNQVNAIQWLAPGSLLALGTTGGVYVASASSRDAGITPTNIRIVKRTSFGCGTVQPTQISDVTIFIQRGGEKVRQLEYVFESDSYSAADLTLLSEHITRGGITQVAYQQDPDSIIWCIRADGALVGMTYEKDQNVFGWHKHVFGGSDPAAADGQAVVESVAVIPGSDNIARDEVWIAVRRWIDGQYVRYIEVMTGGHEPDADVADAFFVDAGLSYSGVATSSLSGLDHLEGETVSILADGATHPDREVVGGAIALARSVEKAHVGLYKNRDVGLLRTDAGSADGTAQGKIKRISSVAFRLYQTVGLLFGPSSDKLDRIPFRSTSDPMDTAVALFTGDKKAPVPSGYDRDGKLFLRQDQPLPFTLLAVMPEVKTNG